jgi:hypothetical protein
MRFIFLLLLLTACDRPSHQNEASRAKLGVVIAEEQMKTYAVAKELSTILTAEECDQGGFLTAFADARYPHSQTLTGELDEVRTIHLWMKRQLDLKRASITNALQPYVCLKH